MKNSFAYVSTTVGRLSIKKTALFTSSSRNMLRGNSDACVSATVAKPSIKPTALLTSFYLIAFNGNRSADASIADRVHPNHISFDCRRFTPPFRARLVALRSSSLGLSIDTSLETGVSGIEEHEAVAVFVCLRDC
ncbi:putative leucine-rich repeat receptor-like protein kinase [Dorcoceras hygrometricum]|uniref:Putative leucine-rich repeat receptor-like protein kinase n=1 Tax=Dorcoceras hygrometricum TaxID=472368 RepID=A0A2Z7AYM1_9LAMI|nr:putative leucine-rich repeat receptor-like protein kinase [Dorcoceras hygrometricum]